MIALLIILGNLLALPQLATTLVEVCYLCAGYVCRTKPLVIFCQVLWSRWSLGVARQDFLQPVIVAHGKMLLDLRPIGYAHSLAQGRVIADTAQRIHQLLHTKFVN